MMEAMPAVGYDIRELKQMYLPQIESLYDQCIWLKDKINLDVKTELRKNEEKLISFIQIISSVIQELGSNVDLSYEETCAIESKIATIILPIRAKLFSKLRESMSMPNTSNPSSTGVNKIATRCVSYDDVVDAMHGQDCSNNYYVSPTKDIYVDNDQLDIIGLPLYDDLQPLEYPMMLPTNLNIVDENLSKKKKVTKRGKKEVTPSQPHVTGVAITKKRKSSDNNLEKSVSHIAEVSSEGSSEVATTASNYTSTIGQDEEILSSRRRRRLSQIVPNPRKVREADYVCSVCNEGYRTQCNENPWWAVYVHTCPKCHSNQIPRIDITLPANAIEIDPNEIALYGEGVEDSGDEMCDDDSDSDSIVEEDPEERARDAHPFDSEGMLSSDEASKLLVLMCHARTCNGTHRSKKHAEICKSTKYLMLHIRDCNGVDVHGRECQFSWCFPCKFMLRHLSNCFHQETCKICNPLNLSDSFKQLKCINDQRSKDISALEAKILSTKSPMCDDCSVNNTMTCSR